jgi:hypothetical protein
MRSLSKRRTRRGLERRQLHVYGDHLVMPQGRLQQGEAFGLTPLERLPPPMPVGW